MKFLKLISLMTLLGLHACHLWATEATQNVNFVDSQHFESGSYINEQARYFIDQNFLSPQEVIRKRLELFPQKSGVPRYIPETTNPVWVLLELNYAARPEQLLFVFTTPWPDRVDFYLINDKIEILEHQIAGDRVPFDKRIVYYRLPTFKPSLKQGEYYLLFRIHTTGPVLPEIRVLHASEFFKIMVQEHYLIAACLGSLIVIGIYNFFLYLSIRDKSYLYYTFYIVSLFFSMGFVQGAFIYYDPTRNGTTWSTNTGIYISINMCCLTAILFCKKFLNMADYMRYMEKFLNIFNIFVVICIFGVMFINYKIFSKLTLLNSMVVTSSLLMASFIAASRGYKPAFFFIPAWTLFLASTLIISLAVSGVGHFTAHQTKYQLIGAAIEGVILSFALGYRIKLIKQKEDEERAKKDHYFSQMEKVFHPHQLLMMQSGKALEDTMPIKSSTACIIAFDIANSSQIGHTTNHRFFEAVLTKCHSLMNQNYIATEMQANAFRIKEVGDGFLCSVGFPFKTPNGEALESFSYKLALQFIEIFKKEVATHFMEAEQFCGIGIAKGEVFGYFPASGPKEYDLFGDSIVLATRYENMRKVLLKNQHAADIIVIQEHVYQGLTADEQLDFVEINLKQAGLKVRDDKMAERLYYRIVKSLECTDLAV